MPRPRTNDYPEVFQGYINQTTSEDPIETLQMSFSESKEFFKNIPAQKQEYSYAPGKWTLKEMLQHIIDCERIFNFRALAFARGETQSIPGFEEDEYAAKSFGNQRDWMELCEEFNVVRNSSVLLFKSFNAETLCRSGVSNNREMTVNALAYAVAGHLKHHVEVIKERYL